MNRFWAGLFALMVTGLAATAVQAATIEITTFGESVDDDGLCSIREAVASSYRASLITDRKTSRTALVSSQELLDANYLRLSTGALEHFPKAELVGILESIRDDLLQHTPVTPAEIADRAVLLDFLVDPDPLTDGPDADSIVDNDDFISVVDALPDNKAFFYHVMITRDLIKDAGAIDVDVHDGAVPADVDPPPIGAVSALQLIDDELARLDGRNEADGCDNGSSFDTLVLEEGTYTLTAGEVLLNARLTIRGVGDTTIIRAGTGTRLFTIPDDNALELNSVQLSGGDVAGNGGAIYVGGSLTAEDVLFSGNSAVDGGAIFVEGSVLEAESGGSLTLSGVRFFNNIASGNGGAIAGEGQQLDLTDVVIGRLVPVTLLDEGNSAAALGGGIYFSPAKVGGSLVIDRASIVVNDADIGSAIFVGGTDVNLSLVNITVARNEAGNRSAIEVATGGTSGSVAINNMTLIENTAVSGTAGLRISVIDDVVIANSLLADNAGTGAADCDFLGVVDPAEFNRNYYGVVSACPGLIFNPGAPDPDATNYQLGAGTAVGYLVNAFDAGKGLYTPIYPLVPSDAFEIRLVNRGAGILEPFRCVERDQRDLARASVFDEDCDIGAVEYQVGRPVDDTISITVNQSGCIEVIGNDIGDAQYIPGSLAIINIERAGATAEVVPLASCPNVADMDPAFPDAILYTPPRGFVGENNVTYSLGWTTGGTVAVTGNVNGVAHVATEPARGISSSSLGNFGLGALALTGLLALRRRPSRSLLALSGITLLAVTASVPATDNIIYVTTALDNAVITDLYGDGECSLREALATARNDQANFTKGDCLDGNEGPDIIEILVPQVTLVDTVQAYGGVTVRCRLENEDPCTISGDSSFRLFNSTGSIAFDRLVLELGDATGYADSRGGGLVRSTSGVTITNSIVRNNTAEIGGAVFLAGIRGDLAIRNSLLIDNVSTGTGGTSGGGVASMSNPDSHKVTIVNSTFVNNSAAVGPAVLDANTIGAVLIANSTFSANTSTSGSGALDFADAKGTVMLRNLTVVGNTSALGYAALAFSGATVSMTSSLISNNVSPGNVDANCLGAFAAYFNVYGESVAGATCPLPVLIPANSNTWRDRSLIFDGVGPDDLAALNIPPVLADLEAMTLDEDGFVPPHHRFADPLGVDGILVDAGYDDGLPLNSPSDSLVDPLDPSSPKCANVDLRNTSRDSGRRCDVGAYEWVQITAVDDAGSNVNRRDRIAIIDVLDNSLVEDAARCVPASAVIFGIDATHSEARLLDSSSAICARVLFNPSEGDARFLPVVASPTDDEPDRRIVDDSALLAPDNDSEYEIDTDSEFVLAYRDLNGSLYSSDEPLTLVQYALDSIGTLSDSAEVAVSILNVPPKVEDDTVRAPVGATVVIDVLANDIDDDRGQGDTSDDLGTVPTLSATGLRTGAVKISGSTCSDIDNTVDRNGDGKINGDDTVQWDCQFGKVTLDPATGVLTWVPDNSYNPFTETFSYEVKDYAISRVPGAGNPLDEDDELVDIDKSESATGTVTIIMSRPSANGGSILGEDDLSDMLGIDFLGATGNLFFLALGLGALRRRSVRR